MLHRSSTKATSSSSTC